MIRYLTLMVVVFITAIGAYAQDVVTQDDIDDVASRMFCPVCENEPLDQCYNPTCLQWKREIRDLLAQGYTTEEILTSFVNRYGQHVVGVPQDPVLRFLSFSAPIIGTILAVIIGFLTFQGWRKHTPIAETATSESAVIDSDNYRSRIERDLT